MRKIKNFKVNLRVRDILRVVKKFIDCTEMSVELERIIQDACRFYVKFLSPSVVYDTFSKESIPFVADENVPLKWIAQSVFFVTIGTDLESEYKKNEEVFGGHTGIISSAIAVDALEQSKNFVQRLIANEARNENCEIIEIIDVQRKFYEDVSKIVPIGKIGISLESGSICPKYSSSGLFCWVPSRKKSEK